MLATSQELLQPLLSAHSPPNLVVLRNPICTQPVSAITNIYPYYPSLKSLEPAQRDSSFPRICEKQIFRGRSMPVCHLRNDGHVHWWQNDGPVVGRLSGKQIIDLIKWENPISPTRYDQGKSWAKNMQPRDLKQVSHDHRLTVWYRKAKRILSGRQTPARPQSVLFSIYSLHRRWDPYKSYLSRIQQYTFLDRSPSMLSTGTCNSSRRCVW